MSGPTVVRIHPLQLQLQLRLRVLPFDLLHAPFVRVLCALTDISQ